MSSNTFLLLGGYGGVGRALSRLMLKELDCQLIIAGRRLDKAANFARQLNTEFPGNRVSARFADAENPVSLNQAFAGIRMALVLSTTPFQTKTIGQAALQNKADYLDILVQKDASRQLKELKSEIIAQDRTFISGAGFHPGLPAVFISYAAPEFDQYRTANILMAMNAHFEQPSSTVELVREMGAFDSQVFKDGKWKRAQMKDFLKYDFGPPFGKQSCAPLQMDELLPLPEKYGLTETGVFAGGFNPVFNNLIAPLVILIYKIFKESSVKFLCKLLYWGINSFSSGDMKVDFILLAEGVKDGKPKKLKLYVDTDDPYLFTAGPIVCCLKQYLAGTLKQNHLGLMGNMVDEKILMRDMESLGIPIKKEYL